MTQPSPGQDRQEAIENILNDTHEAAKELAENLDLSLVEGYEALAIIHGETYKEPEQKKIHFTSSRHKEVFLSTMLTLEKIDRRSGKVDPEYGAALYILSSDEYLWDRSRPHIRSDGIAFNAILKTKFSYSEKNLVRLACNLLNNYKKVSPVEVTRDGVISDESFEMVLEAYRIRHYSHYITDIVV